MTSSKPPEHGEQPIQDFSNCHDGILKQLDRLGELPALMAPAARARQVAGDAIEFFREAIFEHHQDEERELFPAVLASAAKGDERDLVQLMMRRLTQEHRELEATWKHLEPGLRRVAKGHAGDVKVAEIEQLVTRYRAHAEFEEKEFLPLSQLILGRNANHMSALGLSLHMRHTPLPVKGYI
ncbi:MAG: hemerythrin domain-containing protein [Rubrivivax sp.]|nr:hemerythrin domain-containing protein [Rubrivivax sp.]